MQFMSEPELSEQIVKEVAAIGRATCGYRYAGC